MFLISLCNIPNLFPPLISWHPELTRPRSTSKPWQLTKISTPARRKFAGERHTCTLQPHCESVVIDHGCSIADVGCAEGAISSHADAKHGSGMCWDLLGRPMRLGEGANRLRRRNCRTKRLMRRNVWKRNAKQRCVRIRQWQRAAAKWQRKKWWWWLLDGADPALSQAASAHRSSTDFEGDVKAGPPRRR